jgi:hypothetical protein
MQLFKWACVFARNDQRSHLNYRADHRGIFFNYQRPLAPPPPDEPPPKLDEDDELARAIE